MLDLFYVALGCMFLLGLLGLHESLRQAIGGKRWTTSLPASQLLRACSFTWFTRCSVRSGSEEENDD